jgi:hypothetical protein
VSEEQDDRSLGLRGRLTRRRPVSLLEAGDADPEWRWADNPSRASSPGGHCAYGQCPLSCRLATFAVEVSNGSNTRFATFNRLATNVHNPPQPCGAYFGWHFDVVSRYRTGACQMPTTSQDDSLEVSVSRLCASGAITEDATSVVICFGQGDDALRREVRVAHRKFPNSGGWSFSFVLFAADRPRCAGASAKRAILRHDTRCSHEVARCVP